MKSPPRDRRSLFDVGAAGPIAGLALALHAVVVGLRLSKIAPGDETGGGLVLGLSLILELLTQVVLGLSPHEADIVIHPIAFAGRGGLFVTAMGLLPVGQLDGGHVSYALFGGKHIWISRFAVAAIFGLALGRL
jgi:membrane-associated protease RseP (regulator of RpoE activity)